jgi:hypothetical protein
MRPVDPSVQAIQLAAVLRDQLATPFRAGAKGRPAAPAAPEAGSAAGTSETEMQQWVTLRVRALSPNDPQRQRKAFRIFLESMLAQALGRGGLLDAAAFDPMVDAVLRQMEGDGELQAALREAGRLLLAEAAPAVPPTRDSGTA